MNRLSLSVDTPVLMYGYAANFKFKRLHIYNICHLVRNDCTLAAQVFAGSSQNTVRTSTGPLTGPLRSAGPTTLEID